MSVKLRAILPFTYSIDRDIRFDGFLLFKMIQCHVFVEYTISKYSVQGCLLLLGLCLSFDTLTDCSSHRSEYNSLSCIIWEDVHKKENKKRGQKKKKRQIDFININHFSRCIYLFSSRLFFKVLN